MPEPKTAVRQSVSLPSGIARRVQALAKRQRTSANRVIVELIETGLEAQEREKKAFFQLADRLAHSSWRDGVSLARWQDWRIGRMARPPWIEFPGAMYHAIVRGNMPSSKTDLITPTNSSLTPSQLDGLQK